MNTITTKDGVEMFYKDWGSGQPIVFHHGWPLSGDDWDGQMLYFLEKGYRVIAIDRRGHGRSSQVGDGHDMDHYAADAAAVVEHLDLRNAVHVGHSTVGARRPATSLATARPSRQAGAHRSVPPIMVKTRPIRRSADRGVDGLRRQLAANRAQFYLDFASGPFYGYNLAGARRPKP